MRFLPLLVLFTLVFVFGPGSAAEPDFLGEIHIGATFPRTGLREDYGLSAYYGASASARIINENGGVNGKKLVLIWRDNRSDPEQAKKDITEFVEIYKVPAVIGPLMSDAIMAVRPLARKLGVVVISPMATIDAATASNPWVYRATFTNSAAARAVIRFQREKYGARSCGILYDSQASFGLEMSGIVQQMFTESGGEVVGSYSIYDELGGKDYQTPLKAIAGEKPDFIFCATYAREATEIIHAARDLGISISFCGHYTWDNEVVFDGSGTRLAGTSFASALFEENYSRQVHTFFVAMRDAGMDNPDASAACAFDAVAMIAHALRTGETAADIQKGLLGIRRLVLSTGRITVTPEGETQKPVLIRVVERQGWHMVPVYAERYDP